jgi:hypothetical protein
MTTRSHESQNENRKSDGLWVFFVLTYVLMLLTWGVMAVFQMRAAAATDTSTPPSAFGMVLFLLGGFSPTIAGAGDVGALDVDIRQHRA